MPFACVYRVCEDVLYEMTELSFPSRPLVSQHVSNKHPSLPVTPLFRLGHVLVSAAFVRALSLAHLSFAARFSCPAAVVRVTRPSVRHTHETQ